MASMIHKLFSQLAVAPDSVRLLGSHGVKRGSVDREGGQFGAGLIRGVSLVTRGEALGYGLWLDDDFVRQVHSAAAASGERGLKARFAHPGLSADGIGTVLGRWMNPRMSGTRQVLADLHLLESAHDSPSGDLAGYVMSLAEEAPEMFAASIVFVPDEEAEEMFIAEHQREGVFVSPDRLNRAGLRHARLLDLGGADLVDTPAANAGGLFSFSRGNSLPAQADQLLDFALGVSGDAPDAESLGISPERVKQFFAGYLSRRGLSITAAAPDEPVSLDSIVARVEILEQRDAEWTEYRKLNTLEHSEIRACIAGLTTKRGGQPKC